MNEHFSPAPRRHRLPWLLWVLAVLCIALVLPYLAEQVQYGVTRGEQRARADVAREELARLDKSASLLNLSDTSKAFRLVSQRVGPSVVHIDTQQRASESPRDEWDRRFMPGPDSYRTQGQGSGVIVDDAGFILTNYHVVQNAEEVEVQLNDGRRITDVKVVGHDVLTDLALLKIISGGLVAAEWGDSEQLEVGDWVLAVGNPYGLDRTVTSGIVSGKDRRRVFAETAYQDFLQTDAAVNPGSSGGPLLNIRGQVVGITTAIVGRAYQGISFAIPSEVARKVYERLRKEGKVARGWLGVAHAEVSPEIASELNLSEPTGAVVVNVLPDSPADKAGLRPRDVIIEWNGTKLVDATELPLLIAATPIGSEADVGIIRSGQKLNLKVAVGERPDEAELQR